jgi:O-antigen/teichoic acid export membrane protein
MTSVNPKIRLIFGMFWTLAGNAIATVSALLGTMLLARLLSPREIGTYFLLFSLVTIAAVIAQFGLSKSTVRLIAESIGKDQSSSPRDVVRSIFILASVTTSIICAVLYFYGIDFIKESIFKSDDILLLKPIIIIWIAMLVVRALTMESFRGLHNIKLATLYGEPLTRTILACLLFVLWFFYRESNLYTVTIIAVASIGIIVVIGVSVLYRKISSYPIKESMPYADILNISWPLFVVTLTNVSLSQADIWIIGAFKNESEVALYGAAAKLALIIGSSFNIINMVVPPLIVELNKKKNKNELESLVRAAATFAVIPSSIIILVFMLFSEHVLAIIYGEFYRNASLLLVILSVGQFVNVCTGSAGVILSMTGNQNILMRITTTSAAFMLIGGVLVAPYYGSTGVATVAATAMILSNILAVIAVKKRLGIWSYFNLALIKANNLNKIISLLKERLPK